MPKYYKRGALGRMIEAEGGSSDPDLAEVRMTEEEYRGLWDRIRRSEKAYERMSGKRHDIGDITSYLAVRDSYRGLSGGD